MNKKSIYGLILLGATTLAVADVPVIDYSAEMDQNKQAVTAPLGNSLKQNFDESESSAGLSSAQRLNKLEQQVNNLNQQELSSKIDELQQRVQTLTGQVEEQSHQIEQLNTQVRSFYEDLDKRIVAKGGKSTAPVKSANIGSASEIATAPAAAKIAPDTSESAVVSAGAITEAIPGTPVAAVSTAAPAAAKPAVPVAPAAPASDSAFLREQQMYQTGIDLLSDKSHYDDSAKKLRAYLSAYPHGIYVANAHYWLGEVYFSQDKLDAAINEFQTVITKFPTSKKIADAHLKVALSHDKQGKHEQAMQELRQVVKRYPGTSAAQLAKQQVK